MNYKNLTNALGYTDIQAKGCKCPGNELTSFWKDFFICFRSGRMA